MLVFFFSYHFLLKILNVNPLELFWQLADGSAYLAPEGKKGSECHTLTSRGHRGLQAPS